MPPLRSHFFLLRTAGAERRSVGLESAPDNAVLVSFMNALSYRRSATVRR